MICKRFGQKEVKNWTLEAFNSSVFFGANPYQNQNSVHFEFSKDNLDQLSVIRFSENKINRIVCDRNVRTHDLCDIPDRSVLELSDKLFSQLDSILGLRDSSQLLVFNVDNQFKYCFRLLSSLEVSKHN